MSKKFYSGFSLFDEEKLFCDFIISNDYSVSGFSFGAQEAFKYVLETSNRVDKLQLFSPAFFQDKDKKYKRMQLMFFRKDAEHYCKNFLENCVYPSSIKLDSYFKRGSYEDLEALLNFEWAEDKLRDLKNKGVEIDVFLGADDKIINSTHAKEFFTKYATVYTIKNAGHILKVS